MSMVRVCSSRRRWSRTRGTSAARRCATPRSVVYSVRVAGAAGCTRSRYSCSCGCGSSASFDTMAVTCRFTCETDRRLYDSVARGGTDTLLERSGAD